MLSNLTPASFSFQQLNLFENLCEHACSQQFKNRRYRQVKFSVYKTSLWYYYGITDSIIIPYFNWQIASPGLNATAKMSKITIFYYGVTIITIFTKIAKIRSDLHIAQLTYLHAINKRVIFFHRSRLVKARRENESY